MKITGSNWVAGQQSHLGMRTFTSFNPRTRIPGDILFYNATPEEVHMAARAAESAYRAAQAVPAVQRADLLERIAVEIESLGDELLDLADWETALGKPRLANERQRMLGQLRAFADLIREGSYVEAIIDRALPDRKPSPRPSIRRMLEPLGPVGVFTAGNFPFAFGVAGGDTASAFAAGCPVVVKGHPGQPGVSELFALAINRAVEALNFPQGYFSFLQDDGFEAGQALVTHPSIQAVGFTGSQRGGRALFDAACARKNPIPVYAEMGSTNPLVILPAALSARLDTLSEQLAASATLGTGQFCTKPGLVFLIDEPQAQDFIQKVTGEMEDRDPGVLLYEKIEQGLLQTVGNTQGKEDVSRLTVNEWDQSACYAFPNTVLQTTSHAFRKDPELQTEHFGPVILFVLCASIDDLLETLASLEGSLTATIHADDLDLAKAKKVLEVFRDKAGRLIWNGFPTGVEVVAAMQHGGPYPATTAPATTSVGVKAINRFLRPVAYQNFPQELLPDALKDSNPSGIWRLVDGQLTKEILEEG
jgi:NADP-dependent aldehyde dehydrogenase